MERGGYSLKLVPKEEKHESELLLEIPFQLSIKQYCRTVFR